MLWQWGGEPWFRGWHQFWRPVRWQGYLWWLLGLMFFGAMMSWEVIAPSGWKIWVLMGACLLTPAP